MANEANIIKFKFEYEGQTVTLPINPSVLPIARPGANESADIVGFGEITIPKMPKLADLKIDGFLPSVNDNRPSIITADNFKPPRFYIDFFQAVRFAKKPCRLVVSGLGVAGNFTIEDFEFKHVAASPDVEYSLTLKEYKAYGAQKLQIKVNPATKKITVTPSTAQPTKRANTGGAITFGAVVIVNGQLHRDSFGAGAGATKTNYRGKINFIKTGRAYPYHVTTLNGEWLGWVKKSAVRLA